MIPYFYDRDKNGIPRAWVERMRKSMAELTPRFSSNRMLREYVNRFYLPACHAYENRGADRAGKAVRLCKWQETLQKNWHRLRFGNLDIQEERDMYHFTLPVHLDGLDPDSVMVQIYADGHEQEEPEIYPMDRGQRLAVTEAAYVYILDIPAHRPVGDYAPRIIPFLEGAAAPLEAPYILWYR